MRIVFLGLGLVDPRLDGEHQLDKLVAEGGEHLLADGFGGDRSAFDGVASQLLEFILIGVFDDIE